MYPGKEMWNDFVDRNRYSSIFQRYEIVDVYNKTRNMSGLRLAASNEIGELLAESKKNKIYQRTSGEKSSYFGRNKTDQ